MLQFNHLNIQSNPYLNHIEINTENLAKFSHTYLFKSILFKHGVSMTTHKFSFLGLVYFLIFFSSQLHASGISLGTTRIIYNLNASQALLSIQNSTPAQRYLINAWVEDETNIKTKQFVITPPLFVSEANNESTLRIMNTKPITLKDRESLFYVNVKAIPAADREKFADHNVLNLAILSRIKMFVRPEQLDIAPNEAVDHLSFKQTPEGVSAQNDSPYYITLVNISSGDNIIESVMIAPKSQNVISQKKLAAEIQFQNVNDYGALSPVTTKKIT